MSIWEIEQSIMALVDPETGEITDFEALDNLAMARDEKIENLALWIKNLNAEAKAIREEEKNLAERRQKAENKAESLKAYLTQVLNGEKFKTAKTEVSWRESETVEVSSSFVYWAKNLNLSKFLNIPAPPLPSANKIAIKAYIKRFGDASALQGVTVEKHQNIQIK